MSKKKYYFTLVGTKYYYGKSFLEVGMHVYLVKEPTNDIDHEAIMVVLPGLGKIGYVANSPYTVVGESYSAGRLYDKIDDNVKAKIILITEKGILCKLKIKDPTPQSTPQTDQI